MNDINLCKSENSLYFKKIKRKADLVKTDQCDGYLIESSEKESRRIIDSLKSSGKALAVLGGDNHYNRRTLETMKIDYLVSPEAGIKKDTLKQRDSGLNHVLAKIAKKNNISIIIDYQDIAALKGKKRAQRLARIIQNIKVCRKTNTTIRIASFATKKLNVKEVKIRQALGTSLGMSSKQTKESTKF